MHGTAMRDLTRLWPRSRGGASLSKQTGSPPKRKVTPPKQRNQPGHGTTVTPPKEPKVRRFSGIGSKRKSKALRFSPLQATIMDDAGNGGEGEDVALLDAMHLDSLDEQIGGVGGGSADSLVAAAVSEGVRSGAPHDRDGSADEPKDLCAALTSALSLCLGGGSAAEPGEGSDNNGAADDAPAKLEADPANPSWVMGEISTLVRELACTTRDLDPGEVLIAHGEKVSEMYFVLSGNVVVGHERWSPEGQTFKRKHGRNGTSNAKDASVSSDDGPKVVGEGTLLGLVSFLLGTPSETEVR